MNPSVIAAASWGGYTVFSVLSGIILILGAILGENSVKDRFWLFFGGVALCCYGFYVANQTSGTYYFSIWIFIVPFLGVLYAVASIAEKFSHKGGGAAPLEKVVEQPKQSFQQPNLSDDAPTWWKNDADLEPPTS